MTGLKHTKYHRPLSVLLAEDDADLRFILSHSLRQGGYLVQEVDKTHVLERKITALQAMLPSERPVDIVVADIEMANGGIIPILFEYRDFISSFPTILITSDKSAEVIEAAELLGVYDVLAKPFDLPFLYASMCHAIVGKKRKEPYALAAPF